MMDDLNLGAAGGGGPGDKPPKVRDLLEILSNQLFETRQSQTVLAQNQALLTLSLSDSQTAIATQFQELQKSIAVLKIVGVTPPPLIPVNVGVPPPGPAGPVGPGPVNPPGPGYPPAALTPLPKRYSGDPLGFQQFILQCELHFRARPAHYNEDAQKVDFILMLLDGHAFQWAAPLLEGQDVILQNYVLFRQAFAGVFQQQYHAVSRRQELMEIEQGELSVIDYIARFSTLATRANCSEEMKISIFHRGLKGEIQDTIMMVDPLPITLDAFVGLALRMEHQLKARKSRIGKRPAPVPFFQTPVPNVVPDLGEPMVLGAGHISATEKERRRELNLCLYCGKGGHLVAQCPVKPLNARELGVLVKGANKRRGDSQVMGPVVDKSSTHLLLKGSLLAEKSGRQIPVTALLDCGAPGSYIDQSLFQRLGLKRERKQNVQTLTSLDGRRLKGGPIAQRSPKVMWQMQGFSPETMHFDIIHSPRFQVILGMDWLRRNNPLINWVTGEVSRAPEGVSRGDCGAAEQVFTCGESTSPPLIQGPRGSPKPARGKSSKVKDPFTIKGETLGAMSVGQTTEELGEVGILPRRRTPVLPLLKNPHGGGTVGLMRPLLRKDLKQRRLFTPSAVLVQAPISLDWKEDRNDTGSYERMGVSNNIMISQTTHLARIARLSELYSRGLDPPSRI